MTKRILHRVLSVLLLAASLGTLAGCNTVSGMGQDLQDFGKWLRGESNQHRA